MLPPFNLQKWIDENRHLLKPPVGNRQVYVQNSDFIVMIVGGPNARKDYHYNHGEELFYQLEGDMLLKVIENDTFCDIHIRQGDMFLLPPKTPHLPVRYANTIGLVIERYRFVEEPDSFLWYCENCGNKLHEHTLHVSDIVTQLPTVMNNFYENINLCTCNKCGTMMEKPIPPK
ncbi:MAG: 3-hydroxyanthranilate 3,4-dioxygenase [Cytophagales bacterium]|nr:3-hydroxyanthranilate 3,4-dioxygenase [Cytophagales bacterium]